MQDFWIGTVHTLVYFVICASVALLLRKLIHIPDEIFRKLLHCILLGVLPVYVFGFQQWWTAAVSCVVFAAVVYPVLCFFERFRTYSQMVTERKKGELKSSLLLVFAMFAVVISVCWGGLSDRWLVLCCVYAWGFGDAAAALIGKRYGKHKLAGGKKSWEGTISMFAVSFACVFSLLLLRGNLPWYACLLSALPTAAAVAATELYTPGGFDTVTCPICAMVVLLPCLYGFGGIL